MLTLIDHTDPTWDAAYRSHGRENGAATYSRELVKFQVPVWDAAFPGADITISTCPLLYGEAGSRQKRPVPGGDLLVQYLHEWRFRNPTRAAHGVYQNHKQNYKHVIFVTAYKQLQLEMQREGLNALYVPMSIDTQAIAPYRYDGKRNTKVLAYFGNVSRVKGPHYEVLRKNSYGSPFVFQHIYGKQPEVWNRLSQYAYGAGVGRCALEMAALGMKVLITGRTYGGLVMDHGDYLRQQSTNFNARIVTGPQDLFEGLHSLKDSMLWKPLDSREAVEWLKTEIWGLFRDERSVHYARR